MPVLEEEADNRVWYPGEIKRTFPGGGFSSAVVVFLGQGTDTGCGYNAACYAEGRRCAQQFLERMSTRRPLAAELLSKAAESYREAADAMQRVSEVFRFSHDEQGPITDDAKIQQTAGMLAEARDAETQAMASLTEITKIQPRQPTSEST